MNTTPLIFVLYDSVTNSVFEGQIKSLLHKKARENPYRPVHLVTFERHTPRVNIESNTIRVTCLKRIPFVGWLSLWYATKQLTSLLKMFPDYTIIARGPLAGTIAQNALKQPACKEFIIQARGLLAQEYQYMCAQKKSSSLTQFIHRIRIAQFAQVEKKAYRTRSSVPKTIEAVSPALKDHLISTYNTQTEHITIAGDDIPQSVTAQQKKEWRTHVRTTLNIPEEWTVYCYNGSAKAWQKPHDVLSFFNHTRDKHPNSFLLILTTDITIFKRLIGDSISTAHYALISVSHKDIYRYLCAADYGILFRDNHLINWISRPTKVLEYQAAGLDIIHNNTVAYMIKDEKL